MAEFQAWPFVLEPVGSLVAWAGTAIFEALGAGGGSFVALECISWGSEEVYVGIRLHTLMRRSRQREQPVLWGTPTILMLNLLNLLN